MGYFLPFVCWLLIVSTISAVVRDLALEQKGLVKFLGGKRLLFVVDQGADRQELQSVMMMVHWQGCDERDLVVVLITFGMGGSVLQSDFVEFDVEGVRWRDGGCGCGW